MYSYLQRIYEVKTCRKETLPSNYNTNWKVMSIMVRKTQYCGTQRRKKGCVVSGEELKKEISFHQCSKIMRKTAVCKDEIWGIWGRKKRHKLKKHGKKLWGKQWLNCRVQKGKHG